jgi:hypothetical protein
MLGAEECFVNDMQAPVLLVNEIREVLARVVKLENAIESLTVSTHNAQAHQWDAIHSVATLCWGTSAIAHSQGCTDSREI